MIDYDFHVFPGKKSTSNFQFFICIVSSSSKVLKTSRPANEDAYQLLSEFNIPNFC